MTNHATLTVHLAALASNFNLLKHKLGNRLCAAVVKANAYGLGVETVSTHLHAEGCRQFFVATLAEGIQLRTILPDAHIYIFQGILPGEMAEFKQHKLIPVLNSMKQIEYWQHHDSDNTAALHIDTGMTRLGLTETEALGLAQNTTLLGKCNIKLIMSHLACANDGDMRKSEEQRTRFDTAFRKFPQPVAACFANSAGIFLSPNYHYDMARPGCALYGIAPIPGQNPMEHVATLSAPLLQIRTLDRDETVGYGATCGAQKNSRIAITALGYADGFSRAISNKGYGFIGGKKAPIIGRVSMDMIALDVSDIDQQTLSAAGRAEFINNTQTVNDVADIAGTIGYEIFTSIGARVERIYI